MVAKATEGDVMDKSITLGEMNFRYEKLNKLKSIIDDPAMDFKDKMEKIKTIADEQYSVEERSPLHKQFDDLFKNSDRIVNEFFGFDFNKAMNS